VELDFTHPLWKITSRERSNAMRTLRSVLLIAAIVFCGTAVSQARVFVSFGFGPVIAPVPIVYAAPYCDYGYYAYYPYACAPYGYYGDDWFVGGLFIGAGPWGYGWGTPFGYYGYRAGYGYQPGRGYFRGGTGIRAGTGIVTGGRSTYSPLATTRPYAGSATTRSYSYGASPRSYSAPSSGYSSPRSYSSGGSSVHAYSGGVGHFSGGSSSSGGFHSSGGGHR
jgi:hypothetical protein